MRPILASRLDRLFEGMKVSIAGDPATPVTSIATDSRAVRPGAVFFCLHGQHADGHRFAANAVNAGAAAVVTDHPLPHAQGAAQVVVDDTLAALSRAAATFYENPSASLTMIGVTGTNGKTTTTYFIEAITRAAGERYGVIGTLGARIGESPVEDLTNTTPLAHDMQRLLAGFRDAGARGAVLEVSSHALELHRLDDVDFDLAVLTNVTQDHLDFHQTFDAYLAAKRKLFSARFGKHGAPPVAILNLDDHEGQALARELHRQKNARVLSYSVTNPDALLRASDITMGASGSRFWVRALRPSAFDIRLPGAFNIANAMAAIATATALDIDVEAIAQGLESVREVPGRMISLPSDDIGVFVDYAHTPDGMEKLLRAVRELTQGKLVCVFGCGGDRDAGKRPKMGAIAQTLSDVVILTNDNPRHERPEGIVEQILAGMSARDASAPQPEVILDRAAAIDRAIALAQPGDAVVIAGKGHENYQLFGDERRPFSDIAAAQMSLRKKGTSL